MPTSNFRRYSHSSRQSGNYRIIGANINVSTSRVIFKPFAAISSPCVQTFFSPLSTSSLSSVSLQDFPFPKTFANFHFSGFSSRLICRHSRSTLPKHSTPTQKLIFQNLSLTHIALGSSQQSVMTHVAEI